MSNDDMIDAAGVCAEFCDHAIGGATSDGIPHAEFCTGVSRGGLGVGPHFERTELWLNAVSPYFPGPTPRSVIEQARDRRGSAAEGFVGLYVEQNGAGNDAPDVMLTAGEARQLAAALVWLADNLEWLDRPHPSTRHQ